MAELTRLELVTLRDLLKRANENGQLTVQGETNDGTAGIGGTAIDIDIWQDVEVLDEMGYSENRVRDELMVSLDREAAQYIGSGTVADAVNAMASR